MFYWGKTLWEFWMIFYEALQGTEACPFVLIHLCGGRWLCEETLGKYGLNHSISVLKKQRNEFVCDLNLAFWTVYKVLNFFERKPLSVQSAPLKNIKLEKAVLFGYLSMTICSQHLPKFEILYNKFCSADKRCCAKHTQNLPRLRALFLLFGQLRWNQLPPPLCSVIATAEAV